MTPTDIQTAPSSSTNLSEITVTEPEITPLEPTTTSIDSTYEHDSSALIFSNNDFSRLIRSNSTRIRSIPTYRQDWQPENWQLSATTRYFSTDNMGGFYNNGIYVTELQQIEDGLYQMSAGGFSSATGDVPARFELSYVRKTPMMEIAGVDDNYSPIIHSIPGGFESKGPSFQFAATYQNYDFTDYSWDLTLSDRQLMAAIDSTSDQISDQFDTSDTPTPGSVNDLDDVEEYVDELESWANSKEAGFSSIPGILGQMFDGYDINNDYETRSTRSEIYQVPTVKLDAQICIEDSVYRYDKRVNLFHSGRACLEGSAYVLAGNHFENNFYLGIGPYLEWTLASYHQKPFRKPEHYGLNRTLEFVPPSLSVSTYIYTEAQYFNGFSLSEGFDDQSRFITANFGLGVRTTIPSFRKRKN